MNTELQCPKCTGSLRRPEKTGTPVLRCYDCAGMWLAREEADTFLAEGQILDPESLLPQAPIRDDRGGLCPGCQSILSRARVYWKETFYVERCTRCHGIWFDAGEWARLAEAGLLDRLDELWAPDFQKAQRQAASADSHRKRLIAMFGDDLVASLDQVAAALRKHPDRGIAIAYLNERLDER